MPQAGLQQGLLHAGLLGPEFPALQDRGQALGMRWQEAVTINLARSTMAQSGQHSWLLQNMHYTPKSGLAVTVHGHGVKVAARGMGHIHAHGARYDLDSFHFHSPGEHTRYGAGPFAEMHAVHKHSVTKQILVLGVQFNMHYPKSSEIISTVLARGVPRGHQTIRSGRIDLGRFLKTAFRKGFFHYTGSLTTPPCTEGVLWYIADEMQWVSQSQVDDLSCAAPANLDFRSVHPLHGRTVTWYHQMR